MQPRNILCIEDRETCHLYDVLFSDVDKGLKVTAATNLDEALDLLKDKRFDLYILEPYRRESNGIEFCKAVRETDARTPIVFYSGMSREIDRAAALEAGANAYLIKGSDFDRFIETVEEFLN